MAGVRKRLGSLLGPRGVIGPRGVQGLPGFEAVPTAEGIAQNVILPGPAQDALMSRYVSKPVMYGAGIDKTGATDSTAAMQAFIDAHPNATIYVPVGVYKFTRLTLTRGQILEGSGRSTYRDRYSTFGTAGWLDNANFGGTVLRSTATTGDAIVVDDVTAVTEGGLENLTFIGPGAGTSRGIRFGNDTGPIRSAVNIKLDNVVVGNFAVGVALYFVNEGVFSPLIIRGCLLGLDFVTAVNHNTFIGLDIQWCGTGHRIATDCYSNGYYSPIFQSTQGTAVQVFGSKNAFYNPYLENNDDGIVFESGARGNSADSPFINDVGDRIWLKAGADENRVANVGWTGGGSYIRNEGARNFLQGRMPNLTEMGTDTMIFDPRFAGTPFAFWQPYTPTMGGTGWALGNANVQAAYTKIGRTVHFRVQVAFGSTSTYGTSNPNLSLPVAALVRAGAQATMVKNGVGSYMMSARIDADGGSTVTIRGIGSNGLATAVTATSPATWASGDTLEVYGTYQSAS